MVGDPFPALGHLALEPLAVGALRGRADAQAVVIEAAIQTTANSSATVSSGGRANLGLGLYSRSGGVGVDGSARRGLGVGIGLVLLMRVLPARQEHA